LNFFRRFPRSFWVSNGMELFERLAFYGMYNVLALYLTGTASDGCLGFSQEAKGVMMGVFTFFLFMMPIVGGALADRYGYKRSFVLALGCLGLGYLLTGRARSYPAVFASLLLVSAGGALFKPTLTGTIARTTNEKTSSEGFGIYYMIVNIGGFLGPFASSYLRAFDWKWVFWASSAYAFLMLLPALLLYEEPAPPPESPRSSGGLGQVLGGSARVLLDWRFMILILIFSGFWAVFFQLFFTMPVFLRDYVDTLPLLRAVRSAAGALNANWGGLLQGRIDAVLSGRIRPGEAVPPELLVNLDAGSIILFQLLVSRITARFKPMTAMVGGFFVSGCAMVLAGCTRNPWILVLSIFVLALGEMATSPKFLEYVGKIAPADKVALFLGYGFLPIGIGSFLAGLLSGCLNGALARGAISPACMWWTFGSIGIASALALRVYDRLLAK
jgi:dipeptide/tripeptide permease